MKKLIIFILIFILSISFVNAVTSYEESIRFDATTSSSATLTSRYGVSQYHAISQPFYLDNTGYINNISVRVQNKAGNSRNYYIDITENANDVTPYCISDNVFVTSSGTWNFNFPIDCPLNLTNEYYFRVKRNDTFSVGDYIQFYNGGGTSYSGNNPIRSETSTDSYLFTQDMGASVDVSSKIYYTNVSLNAPILNPSISIDDISLVNNSYHNEDFNIYLNFSVTDISDVINVSYVLDNVKTSLFTNLNITVYTTNYQIISTSIGEGEHSIYWIAENSETQTNSSLYTFTFDTTNPSVEVITNQTQFNTFQINMSNIFNFTDLNLDTCTIILTELENVTTPDNNVFSCDTLYNFSTAGLHNLRVNATDLAGNYNDTTEYNITITPFVYVYFAYQNTTIIQDYDATIYHPDGRIETATIDNNGAVLLSPINNGSLDLGTHNIMFSRIGLLTQNVTVEVNESAAGGNYTFTISPARILLYIRDQETGILITGTNFSANFIASVGTLTSTTTGLVNISNTLFQEETYTVVVSATGYQTETLTFDFTNREIISLTMYVINSSNPNLGVIFIKAVNNFGLPLEGAVTKALQWDSTTSSYIEVSSSTTGADGLGTLNVILNDKVYIFSAALGGISANTSVSEIIDSTENGKTITIKLAGTSGEYSFLLENVYARVTESFNDVTNVSRITFDYSSSIGAIDVCINSYRVMRGSETLLASNCETGTSGIFIQDYYINNSYLTVLKGIVEVDGVEYVINSFEYQPQGSFSDLLEGLGLSLFLVPLFFLGAISLAMLIENVYIGTFLMMIMGGISLALAPNILTKGIVAFLFFMGWATINYGVKSK